MFAFIVAITPEAAGTCAGNDTISTMVTRRSTHASHAKPTSTTKRSAQKRVAMQGGVHHRSSSNGPKGIHVPTSNGELLLTRRHFLFGALGVGALAAVAGGASLVIKKQQEEAAKKVNEFLRLNA